MERMTQWKKGRALIAVLEAAKGWGGKEQTGDLRQADSRDRGGRLLNMAFEHVLLPAEFKKYFWDCDFEQLRMEEHGVFITERILNFGNLPAVRWLLSVIDRSFLMDVVEHSRNLDKKTRNFWKVYYG